jgi:hypothetical protein
MYVLHYLFVKSKIKEPKLRTLFDVFSVMLAFNNIFALFKGEGTGTVRQK